MPRKKRPERAEKGEGNLWHDKKAGRFIWRITVGGVVHRVSDTDPDRAKAAFEKLKDELRRGIDVTGGKQSLQSFAEWWLENVVRRTIGTSTHTNYKQRLERQILPDLGDYALRDLSYGLILEWANALADHYAYNSNKQCLAILTRILDIAVVKRLIDSNPASSVVMPKRGIEQVDELDEEAGLPMTAPQMQAFLVAAGDHFYTPLYTLSMQFGFRRGEVLGLRLKDIDLDGKRIAVRQQVIADENGAAKITAKLKTPKARRDVYIADETVAMLRAHIAAMYKRRLKAGPRWEEHGLLFPSENGTPVGPRNLLRHFYSVQERAKLGEEKNEKFEGWFRFHDLRVTAVTAMRDKGLDLEVVAAIVGHSSIKVTAEIYSKATEARKRAAAEQMQRIG